MTKQDFVREIINYKMMYFEDRDDPIIERAGEIDDDEPKEESWFDEEGDRQDTPPLEDNL